MKTAKRAAGYYFINSPDEINADIDFTKHVVCGVPSMKGTDDIFSTMKENLLWLTNRNKFDFDIQKENRMIKVLADWMEGVGFGCNAMVWTSARTVGQEGARCACGTNGRGETLTDNIEAVIEALEQGARIRREGTGYRIIWQTDTPELALNVQTDPVMNITADSASFHGFVTGDDLPELESGNIGFYLSPNAADLVPVQGHHLGNITGNRSVPATRADDVDPEEENQENDPVHPDTVVFLPATLDGNRFKAAADRTLTPATDYFVRAVAHVNGAEYMGDIERFRTSEDTH